MKSTKIISSLSKEKKWDDLILFALSKETSRIFTPGYPIKKMSLMSKNLLKVSLINVYLLYL